jgi:hypothetical protein
MARSRNANGCRDQPLKHSVSVYRNLTATLLTENDVLSGEDVVVPGWSVPVKDLFA